MGNLLTGQAPTAPSPIPDAFEPGDNLRLFTSFQGRPDYLKVMGSDADTFDQSRGPKYWFDPTAAGKVDNITYNYIDRSVLGKPVIKQFTLSPKEAATVNLPGVHSYPAYVVKDTSAFTTLFGSNSPLNPTLLSSLTDAQMLVSMFGLDSSAIVNQPGPGAPALFVFPPDETRRYYVINYKDGPPLNVGMFLGLMYAHGVGAPGKWDMSGPAPVWVNQLPATVPVILPTVPEPVRPLASNEALAGSIFASAVVYRTDMPSVYTQNQQTGSTGSTGSGGAGLTPAQAAELDACKAGIDAANKSLALILNAAGIQSST